MATSNAPIDNHIRYVTDAKGKTVDVIVPIELWQQIINSINIDNAIYNGNELALVDEQISATTGQPFSIFLLGEDNLESCALQNLEQCYGEDEPEYSLELIKEYNSDYARK